MENFGTSWYTPPTPPWGQMLVHGDFDLNCVQRGTLSLKQVLKQKMLNQEALFRNQVHELHRLHKVQKTLMQDNYYYNSWEQSSLVPRTPPKNYESLEKEARFSSMPKVGSIKFTGEEFHWRPLDLQIPATDFISCVDKNLPKNHNFWDNSSENLESEHPHFDGNGLDPKSLELSLSLGYENRRKQIARTLFDKKTYSSLQNVIDLEEPTEMMLNGDKNRATSPGFTAPTPFLATKLESSFSVLSNPTISKSVAKDPAPEIGETSSMVDNSECLHNQSSFNKALKECHMNIPREGLFDKKQDFTLGKVVHEDLCTVQVDDSSCYSNGPVVEYETSIVVQENDAVDLALMESSSQKDTWDRKSKSDEKIDGKVCLSGSNSSVFRHSIDLCENLDYQCGDDKNEEVGLKSELQKCAVVTRQVGCESSNVEANEVLDGCHKSQNTFQDGHGDKSSASCKSFRVSDNDSSSAKKDRQPRVLSENSKISGFDQYSGIELGYQVIETSASNSNDLKHKSCNIRDSAKVECLAAQSLLQISLDNSSCLYSPKNAGSNGMENDEEQLPQYSSDSYESMVLKLTESIVDDDCVSSSKLLEVSERETKNFSMKLRRGRRMKDFQKEILPGLASLSRHEIREDINIMEAVLRSREYRKMRAKTADKGDLCTPLRTKRSRLNHAGRRKNS